jgi:acyl-CoA synthetase (AMP-forming)/AMP-acid ligase II/acyl carrier protein
LFPINSPNYILFNLSMNYVSMNRAINVMALLSHSAKVYADHIAIKSIDGLDFQYKTLFDEVVSVAKGLYIPELPLRRIAVISPNGSEMSIALLATVCAGVAVPLNPTYTASEYSDYFRIAHVDALLIVGSKDHPATIVAREMELDIYELQQLRNDPSLFYDRTLPFPDPDQLALIMLTSGSTGRPKVVPLTHRNVCTSARDVCRSMELNETDRCLCMWEQFHIGGVVDLLLAPLMSGGQIIAAGSFNASRFFHFLDFYRPTWFQGVPATVHEIQAMAVRNGYDVRDSSLRLMRCVAAKLPDIWRVEFESTFGVPVVRTFGMTEASPLITSTRLRPSANEADSAGFSCGTEIKIAGQDGHALDPNLVGEVAIRGDNVFSGYEGDPELNLETFRDGWFYTGDLGYLGEDGQLFITGRVKDIINRGGEKISPGEVEAVFLSHPHVKQAAAFGNPHRTLGQDVGIAIVPKEGEQVDRTQLEHYAASRLSQFKMPRVWLFLDHLPYNIVGKVQRNALPEIYRQHRDESAVGERAAADDIERVLLDIWRTELDSPSLHIREDFFDAGGDSLSSLRIVLAVEKIYGVSLADDVILHFTTVEKMAAELRKMGVSISISLPDQLATQVHVEGDDFILSGLKDRANSLLHKAKNSREFNAIRHALGSLTTPVELIELLNYHPKLSERTRVVVKAPFIAFKLMRERSRLKQSVLKGMQHAVLPELWKRERLAEHAFLFASSDTLSVKSLLVVGFASRAMRLTAPTYHILSAMDPRKHALLLIRDPWQSHFERGIPGMGDSIEKVSDWLGDCAEIRAYSEVVALGTSAGAVPALIAALRNKWARVLLCGADAPTGHPLSEKALLDAQGNKMDDCPSIVIAYSAKNRRDERGAQELIQIMPKARVVPDDRFKQHALLHELQVRGELKAFLEKHLLQSH